MRELSSNSEFFLVEFLVFYNQSKIRKFEYVRGEDGNDMPDGVYQTLNDLGERSWGVWHQRDGRWQVRFRKRWKQMIASVLGLN
jgi:hypothetical protein